ncbi:CHAD domain containing protein [Thalassoporum mexicanum PCC 7367]|uniref:CHAD domain-containing protein n=1 Tax=Thalassoporum mexicanum TaxID=3457544 RepID=UPI00029FD4F1|nr:CHAD domain-containing protein [Pseudanabaena sp. PCC 7367]AFY71392.1 CHAD domain containing protein [Pseudanabaena sp. PCC 7367]
MTARKKNQTDTTANTPITFATCAQQAIAKHYQKIVKHEPDVFADEDPEALHQMRVGMRRLRSTLQVFADILDLPKAASEKNMARIGRNLGKVRDLDVLQADLKNIYAPTLPEAEQALLAKVFKYLSKKRKVALAKMRSLLASKPYQKFSATYANWLEQPSFQAADIDRDVNIANLAAEFVIPDLLIPTLVNLFQHPGWLVGTNLSEGKLAIAPIAPEQLESELKTHDAALHDLRKQIKRVRYQTEFFTAFYGADYAKEIKHFQTAQEALGKLQDSFVLASLLVKALGKNVETKMPTLTEQLRQQRVSAWQQLRPIQALYIDRTYRDRLIQILLKPTTISSTSSKATKTKSTAAKTATKTAKTPKTSSSKKSAKSTKTSTAATSKTSNPKPSSTAKTPAKTNSNTATGAGNAQKNIKTKSATSSKASAFSESSASTRAKRSAKPATSSNNSHKNKTTTASKATTDGKSTKQEQQPATAPGKKGTTSTKKEPQAAAPVESKPSKAKPNQTAQPPIAETSMNGDRSVNSTKST